MYFQPVINIYSTSVSVFMRSVPWQNSLKGYRVTKWSQLCLTPSFVSEKHQLSSPTTQNETSTNTIIESEDQFSETSSSAFSEAPSAESLAADDSGGSNVGV